MFHGTWVASSWQVADGTKPRQGPRPDKTFEVLEDQITIGESSPLEAPRPVHERTVSRSFRLKAEFRLRFRTFLYRFERRSQADLGAIFIIPRSERTLTRKSAEVITQSVDLALRARSTTGHSAEADINRVSSLTR